MKLVMRRKATHGTQHQNKVPDHKGDYVNIVYTILYINNLT